MRTLEEVQATLQIAKVKEEDLQPVSYCLSFGDYVSTTVSWSWMIHFANTLKQTRSYSLIIRGDKDEHAVLCSEDKTRPICCCLSLDVNLQMSRSQHLLSSCMHRSLEKSFLKIPVFVGFWRILDFDYKMKLLGHVTQLVDSESWSFSRVPLSACLEELGSLEPKAMIEHCLNCYGRRYSIEDGQVMYALDEDKVCRATAQLLLQKKKCRFNLSEFQEVWQQSVPEGMSARLDQLRGLALLDRSTKPETISLLREEDLPEDTLERFNSLFSLREKWMQDDIEPYIQDLCGEKQTTGALLTKHARSSVQSGFKGVYNSRRPVSN
ncbi:hypothetical protein cypCar_00024147 [Cyprinus carpio]|nr:hypothetical protein cypCar_00024147 [Cyprinus carpio]